MIKTNARILPSLGGGGGQGYSKLDLVLIGTFWFILTIFFEFIFGHYVMGHLWNKLLADYNILKGRIWILVLLTTLVAPLITGTLLNK
ncbi:hypothetical protein C9439_05700 [archaeon SCG-AAA382B04]|nr:hypothetical protein C9439_05700 [archaeon SCG-AAA382B04]